MENFYLRNLHAQFFDDGDIKKIRVYFETHMDTAWALIPVQLPPEGTIISRDLVLKFDIHETNGKQSFESESYSYVYVADLPAGYKHITSVILYYSNGRDESTMGTSGDPT